MVSASTSNGTINSNYKYVWSNNIGWINFGCNHCNVHVTDSAITGYAWNNNYGWINLNPTKSGIKNDGEGHLSGFAWGENLGWIDFNNVSINNSGKFTGKANGDLSGVINFDCSNCNVQTDWRPKSVRESSNKIIGGTIMSPTAPEGGFKMIINNDDKYTTNHIVNLTLLGGQDVSTMIISNSSKFSKFSSTGKISYQPNYNWDLCRGRLLCLSGKYTVYVKFFAPWGKSSPIIMDNINYIIPDNHKNFITRLISSVKKISRATELSNKENSELVSLTTKSQKLIQNTTSTSIKSTTSTMIQKETNRFSDEKHNLLDNYRIKSIVSIIFIILVGLGIIIIK